MSHIEARILTKKEVAQDIFKLSLFCPEIASTVIPGQFVHIECGKDKKFILRRPFSVHRQINEDVFEILFQVVGKGTKSLAEVEVDSCLDIIGPLGNGFKIPDDCKNVLLVAGGIGVAPLVFLAEKLFLSKISFNVLIGCANCQKVVRFPLKDEMTGKIYFSTDDGSLGSKGNAADLLLNHLRKNEKPDRIFACGPEPMLKAVTSIATRNGISCFLSLEERMACGIGACLSCVCKTKSGNKRVCVDGPVFNAFDILWE